MSYHSLIIALFFPFESTMRVKSEKAKTNNNKKFTFTIYLNVILFLFLSFFVTEETVSLESPPPENGGHNLSEIISTVLPGQHPEAAEDTKIFAQRAPGSQLRNGSITVS